LLNSDGFSPTFPDEGANTNWFDEILRDPVSYRLNVNMKGGNTLTNYTVNIQNQKRQGVIRDTDNEQTKLRLSATHTMFDEMLKINANVIGYKRKFNKNYQHTSLAENSPYLMAMQYNPTVPVKDENGDWYEFLSSKDHANPLGLIEEHKGMHEDNKIKIYGNLTFKPIEDLSFMLRASLNTDNGVNGTYQTQDHVLARRGDHEGRAWRSTQFSKDKLLEFITTYEKQLGKHKITGVGGYSWEQHQWENYNMNNSTFPSDLYQWNSIGLGTFLDEGKANMGSYKAEDKLVGFFGRINYNFNQKYYLMASLRHEGSSKFGAENKWANFPAFSAGWHLGREPFMSHIDFVDHLKIRAGYGVTGTAPGSPYQSIPRLSLGGNYYYGGTWVSPAVPSSNPNPNLKWEKKKEYNIGLDFGILEDRISFSADYYQRRTEDLIWNYTVPKPPYLYDNILANAGQLENKGVELSLNAIPVQKEDFTWNTVINFSTNNNQVISLEGDVFQVEGGFFDTGALGKRGRNKTTHRVEEGKAVGNFYGFRTVDIGEDGWWIIEGADGNPKSTVDQSPDDRQYLGNGLPNYNLSWNNTLRYKNFSLSISMRGAFDFQILNLNRYFLGIPQSLTMGNVLHEAIEDKFGKRPLAMEQPHDYMSYFIEDGDYWKIDNATLSYSLNPDQGFVRKLMVFITGLNLYTFTGYSGEDPEVDILGLAPGVDWYTQYPNTRSFSLGAEITF